MKARDYFEKYDTLIMEEQKNGEIGTTKKLLLEMSDEVTVVCKQRKAVKDEAVIAVLKEINQKWNAICRMYEKKYGVSPLNYDAFRCYWMTAMPELAGKL